MSEIVRLLSVETGLPDSTVRRIMTSAPVRYKEYLIAKRSGGTRQIAQPAREVKLLQRAFVSTFLSSLPIHQCATAYRAGLSIRDNAAPHIGHGLFSNWISAIFSRQSEARIGFPTVGILAASGARKTCISQRHCFSIGNLGIGYCVWP
jgi:hypothetical protein